MPEPHHTIAYLRVSTIDQDVEKNKAAILALANHHHLGQKPRQNILDLPRF